MIISILLIIAFVITFWKTVTYNLHIYQLNYYKKNVQIKWIKNNLIDLLIKSIPMIIAIILMLLGNIGKIIALFLFILKAILDTEKVVKKPLVYTSRLKRLIITNYIVAFIFIGVWYLVLKNLLILPIIIVLLPILVIISDYINLPINKLINNYYINDAKKKLASMPNLIVIGVTGSYGKTSVKNFLYKFLSTKYNVLITPENYNTTLGVVKTIRENLKATHEIFVCEMGATKPNDIKEICDIVKPKCGIITSIGPQHLESFKSIENVISTKFELERSLPENGIIFLNYDNEYIKNANKKAKVISYGTNNESLDINAYDMKASEKGLSFKIENEEFETQIIGTHNIANIAGAVAVAKEFGIELKNLKARVRGLECVPHRLQITNTPNAIIIDDAYNSNPVGSKYALEALGQFDGTKILLTPGMIELGDKQYECNFEFGKNSVNYCDYIVLVGKKQTKPIADGIISTNYNKENLIIVDNLNEGFQKINEIKTNKRKIVLIENDLPDNY